MIIAAFHAGATQGIGSNYAAEVAKGGEFAQMANLDDSVDVIFNGHTHQVYAWDAPVPGQAGKSRPIVQTGEYASNVGQVTLTVDPATGDVSSVRRQERRAHLDRRRRPRGEVPPRGEGQEDRGRRDGEGREIGNEPVGSVTADITRACTAVVRRRQWTAPARTGRPSRPLGDLVANALRDGLPSRHRLRRPRHRQPGRPPCRPEVRRRQHHGQPGQHRGRGDLRGGQRGPAVRQQRVAGAPHRCAAEVGARGAVAAGAAPSRPFLALGLSDNVRVTQDATKARGSRITSVIINGQPLDPAKTYTVSTFSFLATGGDNFASFKQGTSRDTGLVDRDLWIGYLKGHTGIAPDFARQQVAESGLPQLGERRRRRVVHAVQAGPHPRQLAREHLGDGLPPQRRRVRARSGSSRSATARPTSRSRRRRTWPARPRWWWSPTRRMTQVGLPLTGRPARTWPATAEDMTYGTDGFRHRHGHLGRARPPVTWQVLDGDTVLGTARSPAAPRR